MLQYILFFLTFKFVGGIITSWSQEHHYCINTGFNIECHEQDYFLYAKREIRNLLNQSSNIKSYISSEYKLKILQLILNMYDDLKIERKPLIFNESQNVVQILPISFPVPDWYINKFIPPKNKIVFPVFPGNRTTYINDEDLYYHELETSLFAVTFKKAGWDCFRHVEIISRGVLPIFFNIGSCPNSALSAHPKKLYEALLEFPVISSLFEKGLKLKTVLDINANETLLNITYAIQEDHDFYINICDSLMHYSRNVLSGTAMANYVLESIKNKENKSATTILFITNFYDEMSWGDYMTDLILISLKTLLGGTRVIDFPRKLQIYKDKTEFIQKSFLKKRWDAYGHGFGWANEMHDTLDESERNEETVIANIVNHKYDIIILGDGHANVKNRLNFKENNAWKYVCQYYKPYEVAVIYGSDLPMRLPTIKHYSSCAYTFFSREGFIGMKYRDGKLIRVHGQTSIYLIENNTRREFQDMTVFMKLGYDASQVTLINEFEELTAFTKLGEPIK